jgi:rubredoxin
MLRSLSEDEYPAAVQDAAYEEFLKVAVECADCGALYDQGRHPATRFEPAYIERSECPNCGCGEIRRNDDG